MINLEYNSVTGELTTVEIAREDDAIASEIVQEPSVEEKNRADIDYLAVMTGVEL